jgi:uncharacterized protein with HEPN domain
MRDILIHGYYDVSVEIVWKTVREDLAPLCQAILTILTSLDTDESG